jgi:hypothetical protein
LSEELKHLLSNEEFKKYFVDVLEYGRYSFEKMYKGHEDNFVQGFVRYAKYSAKMFVEF